MSDLILTRDDKSVRTLTLNAPDKLNVLSFAMLDALCAAFDKLERDTDTVRAVILEGAGKAFCVGHDLGELRAGGASPADRRANLTRLFNRCSEVMQRIQALPQPVIAQVQGVATAAGCQLVASCDMAVAAQSARFGVNGVNIGLFCSTPMVALSRNIPRKQAFEMLTTGDFISADRAVALGLVNRVVPDDALDRATQQLAQQVAGKLSSTVRIGKQAFYRQLQMPLDQAYAYTGEVIVENLMDADTDEGIDAFLEKRKPSWQA